MEGAEDSEERMQAQPATLLSYYHCIRDNESYRNLWVADFIDNIGAWLNYVATLELVSHFSDSSLALSAVVLIRFFPGLLLSPLAGVLADSCNRVNILVAAALADAALVACLALVTTAAQTPLLFGLLFGQFVAIALQDPARKAIIPVLVPPEQLHLAATLETFSWSLTGALGAAAGGAIASRLGNSTCFLIDAATYLVAAWCAHKVPRALGAPGAVERRQRKAPGSSGGGAGGVELSRAAAPGSSAAASAHRAGDEDLESAPLLKAPSRPSVASAGGGPCTPAAAVAPGFLGPARPGSRRSSEELGGPYVPAPPQKPPPAPAGGVLGMLGMLGAACVKGTQSMVEGWRYLLHRDNRDVAALVLMKGCGSITWGAVDILNVKFSELPSMQVGDGATTLGLIFATVGLGCFLGPLVLNAFVQPRPGPLLWACAASFTLLFVGSAMMAAAGTLWMVLASTFVRAIGSATLWIYSTLLLQIRIPNSILGRVCAAELAWYTVAEAASSLFGGAAFDVLHLQLRSTVACLTVAAGAMAAAWTAYAWVATHDDGLDEKSLRL